jgi:hypothetical protein
MTTMVTPTITSGWTADKQYTVAYVKSSGLITGLYGSITGFDQINHVNMNDVATASVGTITEDVYSTIGEGIISPHALAFYENGAIKVRKIQLDLGPGTFIDSKLNAIVAVGNKATVTASCIDSNGTMNNDITMVDVKNLNKRDVPISFNGNPTSNYKMRVQNGAPFTVELTDEGRVAVQIKVVVPELSDLWLAIYPEFYGLDDVELSKLADWAQQNAPTAVFGG